PQNEFVAQFIGSPAMNLLPGEVVETGPTTTIRLANGGTAQSTVPTTAADKGRKVNVGVRPEDLVATEGTPVFTGEVEITEALGEVTLLYFKRQGDAAQVVAKLPGIHPDLRRKSVALSADPAKVHLFADGISLLYR
nr:TOBE domain-containing protein [Cypionkella sp.]